MVAKVCEHQVAALNDDYEAQYLFDKGELLVTNYVACPIVVRNFPDSPSFNSYGQKVQDLFFFKSGFGGQKWHLAVYSMYRREIMLTLSGFY